MGKAKFDKKRAVRFTLLPGPEKEGKPSVLYQPVEARKKSRLSKRERKNIISELAGVEEVIINGRKVRDDEIPAYVLDQIRGRGDLVFNQIRGEEKEEEEEEVGDLYDIQDGKEDNEYEEYPDYEDDLEMEKVEEGHEDQDSQEDWEDEEGAEESVEEVQEIAEPAEPYSHKEEDFPAIEEREEVEIDGITYSLTKTQARLLETVIPENYEQLDFGGLSFKKYTEDGLPIADRAKFEKYFLKEDEKVVVIDTYEHVPTKPLDFIDNDFKPSQINGNRNVKEIEEALDYDGEEQVYEEMEDDFFAKMIQDELEQNSKEKLEKQEKAQAKAKPTKEAAKCQPRQKKQAKPERKVEEAPEAKESEEQLEAQLDKALFNFEHNIEEGKAEGEDSEQEGEELSSGNYSMNFTDLEKREEYMGRDGELDWRCLTKKEKREYMKTKVIREFYDELREREIEDKLKGKINVKPEDLHLKDRIRHITYEEDHVLQRALEEDLKVTVDLDAPEESDSSFTSDEDDIVSFHQKTSIIASNLSVIEEPRKKKAPKAKPEQEEAGLEPRVKVVPEQRKKNETAQERRERKERLRAQKKEKKEQKKDFADKFSKIKKQTMRQENANNPLNKVSYVKIY